MAASVSSITIEELTGQKRRLDLFGAGLPLKGANWGSGLVMSTKWNPGNSSQATQHVTAAMDPPSEWAVKWNTTRLVSSPAKWYDGPFVTPDPIVIAASLVEVFELITRSAQRLRVTWLQGTAFDNRKIVREGLCSKADWKWSTADDVEGTLTFEWAGRGPAANRALDLSKDLTTSSLKAANQMLTDYVSQTTAQALVSANSDVPLSADQFSLGQLEAIADLPQQYAQELKQIATRVTTLISDFFDIVGTVATTPQLFASTALQIATQATEATAQTLDKMGQLYPDAASNVDGDAAALITASSYFDDQQDAAEGILGAMAQIREEARRRASLARQAQGGTTPRSILAVIITKQGMTFVKLSLKYYNNPDLGGVIATANGFDEDEVSPPPGTTLVIPTLDKTAATQPQQQV